MSGIFEYTDYKEALIAFFGQHGARSGFKSKMAQTIGCHTTYLAQVLNTPDVHFTMDHAVAAADFMALTESESEYFLQMVIHARAATPALQENASRKMRQIVENQKQLKSKMSPTSEIPREFKEQYFGSWHYSAVHVLASIEGGTSIEELEQRLRLPRGRSQAVIKDLTQHQLVVEDNGRFYAGPGQIHMGEDDRLIARHHSNWRTKVLADLQGFQKGQLHYSGVLSLSQSDAAKIHTLWTELVKKSFKIVSETTPEECYVFCLDFYELQ